MCGDCEHLILYRLHDVVAAGIAYLLCGGISKYILNSSVNERLQAICQNRRQSFKASPTNT